MKVFNYKFINIYIYLNSFNGTDFLSANHKNCNVLFAPPRPIRLYISSYFVNFSHPWHIIEPNDFHLSQRNFDFHELKLQ